MTMQDTRVEESPATGAPEPVVAEPAVPRPSPNVLAHRLPPGGGNAIAVGLFLAAFVLVIVALLLDALCLATTILTLRAPGMTLARVPFFSWSILVSASVLLLSLPVLVGELVYLYIDHRYGS